MSTGTLTPILLIVALLLSPAPIMPALADSPGASEIAGQKVLTHVGRHPPDLSSNNSIQSAAKISNPYRIPIQTIPVAFASPGTSPRNQYDSGIADIVAYLSSLN